MQNKHFRQIKWQVPVCPSFHRFFSATIYYFCCHDHSVQIAQHHRKIHHRRLSEKRKNLHRRTPFAHETSVDSSIGLDKTVDFHRQLPVDQKSFFQNQIRRPISIQQNYDMIHMQYMRSECHPMKRFLLDLEFFLHFQLHTGHSYSSPMSKFHRLRKKRNFKTK